MARAGLVVAKRHGFKARTPGAERARNLQPSKSAISMPSLESINSRPLPACAASRPLEMSCPAGCQSVLEHDLNTANHPDRTSTAPSQAGSETGAELCRVHKIPRAPRRARKGAPSIDTRMFLSEAARFGQASWEIEPIRDGDPLTLQSVLQRQHAETRVEIATHFEQRPRHRELNGLERIEKEPRAAVSRNNQAREEQCDDQRLQQQSIDGRRWTNPEES